MTAFEGIQFVACTQNLIICVHADINRVLSSCQCPPSSSYSPVALTVFMYTLICCVDHQEQAVRAEREAEQLRREGQELREAIKGLEQQCVTAGELRAQLQEAKDACKVHAWVECSCVRLMSDFDGRIG